MKNEWYHIVDIDKIDSPALVVYHERVAQNISTLVSMIDDLKRLRPHAKTFKSKEAASLLINSGVNKFKCATIAEAEMLAMTDARDVLLAYQPTGPKLKRFLELIKKYPSTKFSCLVDNTSSAEEISSASFESGIQMPVYIDLNVGMNRTGIEPGTAAVELYRACEKLNGTKPIGLHAYDGHIRNPGLNERTIECDKAFKPVFDMQQSLLQEGFAEPIIVAGGSPTFPVHAARKNIECSPGTFIYWDLGYQRSFKEQKFLTAALVITRVVSLPGKRKICLDLGHKSIAAENNLDNRVCFLNAPALKFISQSEEHLVVETANDHSYNLGDVFYGLPVHICPTVALYERAFVIENNKLSGEWKTIARDRKIDI
ncbi:MAG: D-TA family PLP-dependent enzyme [Ginsengibacter sp.]